MKEKTFGERLQDLTREKGITLRELAERVDVSDVTMCRIANDNIVPKAPIIVKIAEALNVETDYLLYGKEKKGEKMKSYRFGKDKEIEKINNKLHEIARGCLFRKCPNEPGFSYYYCEEEMYLVRNDMTGVMCIVEHVNSPDKAARSLMMREENND